MSPFASGSAFFVGPQLLATHDVKYIMKKRTTLLVGSALFLVLLAVLFIRGVATPFTPPAPAAWAQISPGMTRSDIIASAGAPQTSGYPEKIIETWYLSGRVGTRQMFVRYDGGGKAETVTEGVFWPFGRGFIQTRRTQ